MKKILLGMLFCLATSTLPASIDELVATLGECQSNMKDLSDLLSTLGKQPVKGGASASRSLTSPSPKTAAELLAEKLKAKKVTQALANAAASATGTDVPKPSPKAPTKEPSPEPKKPELPKTGATTPPKTPSPTPGAKTAGSKVEPKEPSLKTAAAGKKGIVTVNWSQKIDFIRIPHYLESRLNPNSFENFYQAFVKIYVNPVLAESQLYKETKRVCSYKGTISEWNSKYKQEYGDYIVESAGDGSPLDEEEERILNYYRIVSDWDLYFKDKYDSREIEDIKSYIGRAWFEKYVLDFCRNNIIEKHDRDRGASIDNPLWVYKNDKDPLEDIIANVIASSNDEKVTVRADINAILREAAMRVSQSINDLFYHKERDSSPSDGKGPISNIFWNSMVPAGTPKNVVFCPCLTAPLRDGYREDLYWEEGFQKIDLKHPLAKPFAYLEFETMHITMNHGVAFTNRIIQQFDFEDKEIRAAVVVQDKTDFYAGFDNIFGPAMTKILGTKVVGQQESDGKVVQLTEAALFPMEPISMADEKEVIVALGGTSLPAGLIMRQQKNYNKNTVMLVDGKPRMIIYGKRDEKNSENNLYWNQGGAREIFPDGKYHPQADRYNDPRNAGKASSTGKYNLSDDELKFALWLHVTRHQPESVGLRAYQIIYGIKSDKKADAIEVIKNAVENTKEKNRLNDIINGLRRVPAIVAYLLPVLKKVKKPEEPKSGEAKKPTPMTTITVVRNIIDNIDAEGSGRAQVISITEQEWMQIANKLAEDSEYDTKIRWIFEDAEIRAIVLEVLNKKEPGPTRMYTAFDAVNKARASK